jgi:hypothetical protein
VDYYGCRMRINRLVSSPEFFNAQRGCGCCRPPPPPPPRPAYYYYRRLGVPCESCPEGVMAKDWILEVPGGFFDNVPTQGTVPGQGACPYPGTTKCKSHTGTFLLTDTYPGLPVGSPISPNSSLCPRYGAFYPAEGPILAWPVFGLPAYPWANGCLPCQEQGTWIWVLSPFRIHLDDEGGELPPEDVYYRMVLELGFWDSTPTSSSSGTWEPRAIWSSSLDISCQSPNELVLLGDSFSNHLTLLPLCCDDLPETVTVRPL